MPTGNFEPEESRFFPHGIPCGIDEAGRGPYAGPLSLALVAFSPEILESILVGKNLSGLNDSKKLSESKREILYSQIREMASICCHTFVSHTFIDNNGINRAVLEGIRKCYRMALRTPIAIVGGSLTLLIDGNYNFSKYPESKSISSKSHYYTKGDSRIVSISAASIIAKVTRDRWMKGIAGKFPGYGFESHKGYGSAGHEEAIRTLGLCRIHRRSFTKKFQ
ncbi:ribonuclease HII [Leptospira inadai serovar Lyme str. 10]|uniref:Ribonuclease n=2 Tax=Leptospira inadai serovar Lyme TaxID=293084 RepID=V6HKN0_9LEPT|nr:ribonuclease HII [Leptospira inadai]EQA37450.1 ribonuclease HII [Leptospira inadai serovar Lyme str. 10]PNV76302.1 ribonuclease HII [Leptospira inadai serovar Lyme]